MMQRNLILAGVVLVSLSLAPAASGQWVTFNDATGARMPTTGGLNTPGLSTTDPEEKDYAWGDVDHDGDIDLVCVRKQPFTSTGKRANVLFMNEGIAQGHSINGVLVDRTALYASASDIPGDQGFLTPTNDRDVVLADVNNDTWLDIITATTLTDNQAKHLSHPRVYINRGNDGSGNWLGFRYEDARIPQMHPNAGPRFCSVAAGDVTGDGFVDLYFGDYDSGGAQIFDYNNRLLINNGNGFFTDSLTSRMSANPGLISAFGAASVMADMNNDGAMDVVKQTSLSSPTHVAVQHNNPANIGFFPDPAYKTVNSSAPYFVSAGDLNNDGRLDLIVTDDGTDSYLLNTGNSPGAIATGGGTANFQQFLLSGTGGFGSQSIAVDLNNDGWKDILIADVDVDISGCSRRTFIFRNLGNAPNVTFQEQSPSVIPTSMLTGTHNIAAFDINNDGWTDLVIGRCSGTQVWINQPPSGIVFSYPQGLPSYFTPDQPHNFQVQLNPVSGGNVQRNTGKIYISQNGGPFVASNMSLVSGNLYATSLPATACPNSVKFYFSGQLSTGATFFDPPSAPASFYTAVAALGTQIAMHENMEGSVANWTVQNDASLTGGAWQQATPNPTINAGVFAAPYEDATAGLENTKAFVTENGPSNSTNPSNWDVDGGPTRLLSPTINLQGSDATINLQAWFYTSSIASGDVLNVAVSNNNGGTWTNVMDINATSDGSNTVWAAKSFVVSNFVAPTASVRVRFSVADVGAPSVVEAAIDQFSVEQIMCTQPNPCPPDITGDSQVNVNDLLAVINAWGAAGGPADVNLDGIVNVNDLLAVINAWGPCP